MLKKKLLSSKLAIIALAILVVFLGDLKFKQWQNQSQIEKQKQQLQQQADALQKKNDDLNQSLEYLNSPNFKESVARQQLGLQRQGEQVYSYIDAPQAGNQTLQNLTPQNNFQKWWNYFFEN